MSVSVQANCLQKYFIPKADQAPAVTKLLEIASDAKYRVVSVACTIGAIVPAIFSALLYAVRAFLPCFSKGFCEDLGASWKCACVAVLGVGYALGGLFCFSVFKGLKPLEETPVDLPSSNEPPTPILTESPPPEPSLHVNSIDLGSPSPAPVPTPILRVLSNTILSDRIIEPIQVAPVAHAITVIPEEPKAIPTLHQRLREMQGVPRLTEATDATSEELLKNHRFREVLNQYAEQIECDRSLVSDTQKPTLQGMYENLSSLIKEDKHAKNPLFLNLQKALGYLLIHNKDVSAQYVNYVYYLRAAINNDVYKNANQYIYDEKDALEVKCCYIIRKLCFIRFAGVYLHNYLRGVTQITEKAYLDDLVAQGGTPVIKPPLISSTLFQNLYYTREQIAKAPNRVLKDERLDLHVPSVHSTYFHNYSEFHYLCHPSPVVSSMADPTGEVAPDFIAFIEYLKGRSQGYLYVNHQCGVKSLENLQSSQRNFYVLTQPLEGDLFERKKEAFKQMGFAGLKEALISAYSSNDPDSMFALPYSITNNGDLNSVIGQIFDKVHELFFEGKQTLDTLDDWQNCILLFYVFQRMDMKQRIEDTNAGTYRITCMSSVCGDLDKGDVSTFAQDLVMLYGSFQENDKEKLEELLYNTMGAPIGVKNLGLALVNYLEHYFKAYPEKIHALGKLRSKEWSVYNVVKKIKEQSAYPSITTSRTPNEIRFVLKMMQKGEGNQLPSSFANPKQNLQLEGYKKAMESLATPKALLIDGKEGTILEEETILATAIRLGFFSPRWILLGEDPEYSELSKVFNNKHVPFTINKQNQHRVENWGEPQNPTVRVSDKCHLKFGGELVAVLQVRMDVEYIEGTQYKITPHWQIDGIVSQALKTNLPQER